MISFVGRPRRCGPLYGQRQKASEEADIVIYELFGIKRASDFLKRVCLYIQRFHDLEEIIEVMEREALKGKNIVRLHTGDPSIYGAIKEQMDLLEQKEPRI